MSYVKTLDAYIPQVYVPEDISEQKSGILGNYYIAMDMLVTATINTLITKSKIDGLINLHLYSDDYIKTLFNSHNQWLDSLIAHQYTETVSKGMDKLNILYQDFKNVVYGVLVGLFRKYFHLVRETISKFVSIAHAETNNTYPFIDIVLIGIKIDPTVEMYTLRAEVRCS